jgi:hypothetical protein
MDRLTEPYGNTQNTHNTVALSVKHQCQHLVVRHCCLTLLFDTVVQHWSFDTASVTDFSVLQLIVDSYT